MNITKLIVSVGSAIAAAKVVKSLRNFDVDNVLDHVGLERSRSHFWERMMFFGAGALAGAGAGVLLAPASGRETRKRVGDGIDKLGQRAGEMISEVREQAPGLLGHKSAEHARTGPTSSSMHSR